MSTDLIEILPLSRLHESPSNPRKRFDAAGLAELAESLRSQGLLQPIVVRPILEINSPDYEIVFGHRRVRAAQLAGMGEIPCIVRAMTDLEVATAQIHENLERADVSPLEEADGYATLMRVHGISAEQLAADTGKSRTYVYNRLKLAQLSEPARQAVLQYAIPAEIATLIARVPRPLQLQAVERVTATVYGEPAGTRAVLSFRQARTALQQHFTEPVYWIETEDNGTVTRTNAVDWDPADDSLTTCGACTTCPKLSDNDPGMLEAVGAGVCTDVPCHQAKEAAHEERELDGLRREGRLIEGEAARAIASAAKHIAPTGFLFLTERGYPAPGEVPTINAGFHLQASWEQMRLWLQAEGQPVPPVLVVEHHGAHVKCIRESDAWGWISPNWRVGKRLPISPALTTQATANPAAAAPAARGEGADDDNSDDSGDDDYWGINRTLAEDNDTPEDLPPEQRAAMDGEQWFAVRDVILQRIATNRTRTLDDLRMLARREIDLGSTGAERTARLLGWLDGLDEDAIDALTDDDYAQIIDTKATADELGAFLVMMAVQDMGTLYRRSRKHAAQRVAVATRYGVDMLNPTAAPAGQQAQQTVEAGPAGQAHGNELARDPNTGDMFEGAEA